MSRECLFPVLIPFKNKGCTQLGPDILMLIDSFLCSSKSLLHPIVAGSTQGTYKDKIRSHCHYVVNHLKGLVYLQQLSIIPNHTHFMYGTMGISRKVCLVDQYLTGNASWSYKQECLSVQMCSAQIGQFYCEVIFTLDQTRLLFESKSITSSIYINGRLTFAPSKLIASIIEDNYALRIDDELNPELWLETRIVLWKNKEITSWDHYVEQVVKRQIPLPSVNSLQRKRERLHIIEGID